MNSLLKFFQLNFIPRSSDFALLLARVWFGGSLVFLHGWAKLTGFSNMAGKFPDPLGVGSTTSLSMAVFAEVACAVLVALGLLTRFAALVIAIMLTVAFFKIHGLKLSGPGSGEMAFVYLAGFVTIFLMGPGAYSVDRKLGAPA